MKTLISTLLLFTVAVLFSSCSDTDTVLNSSGMQTDGGITAYTGDASGLVITPPGYPANVKHFEGTGYCTFVGNCTASMDYLILSPQPNGVVGFGRGVLTGEDGNKLYIINIGGTYTLDNQGILHVTLQGVASGGTGRFNNVMGPISITASTVYATNATDAHWEGTIERARPVSGSFVGVTATVTGGECSLPFVRRRSEGYGEITHFGHCFASIEHCLNMSTGLMINGNGSLTSANGDKIDATYYGFVVPIPGTSNATVSLFSTIVSGTGKFTNAKGYMIISAIQPLAGGEAICTVEGVMDY